MSQSNKSATFLQVTRSLITAIPTLNHSRNALVTSVPMAVPSVNTTTASFLDGKGIVNDASSTTVGALILSLVFLLGVPGNLFIIWSILARARKRSVTTLLILNLAFADGSLMALTPFFIVYLVRKSWVFGMVMCKILFYLCLANMYASIHLIMLMSLHRLVAVVWPQRVGTITRRKTVLRVLVGVWVVVLATSVPAIIYREERTKDKDKTQLECASFHDKWQETILQYGLELVLGFFPYGVIVGSYICILRRIRQTKFRRRIRSEKLILAIVVTFCVFWLPYHIINMVQIAAALCKEGSSIKESLDNIWKKYRAVTSSVAFISSCANPVLYTFAGKSYIRRDGFAFMARLFEGTGLDSGTRKGRQNSQNNSRDKDADAVMMKDRDPESTTSANANANANLKPLKNGK